MTSLDAVLVAIGVGLTFWLTATAYQEWRNKELSGITLTAIASIIFITWLVYLSAIDKL